MLPSTRELSGEPSAETSWQSDVSLIPETELALVVAEELVEACGCVVFEVASEFWLWRFGSCDRGPPLERALASSPSRVGAGPFDVKPESSALGAESEGLRRSAAKDWKGDET